MVEIIKPGQLPEEQVYHGTCRSCSTYFRFKRKEARYVAPQFGTSASLEIRCPFTGCEKLVYISLYQPKPATVWRNPVDKDILFD